MTSFKRACVAIKSYVDGHSTIATLERGVINEIIGATATEIVVQSRASRGGKERHLTEKDFRFAWRRLVSKGVIGLRDIDPQLRGRRAIIFAFLAQVPGVSYSLKPLRLHSEPP